MASKGMSKGTTFLVCALALLGSGCSKSPEKPVQIIGDYRYVQTDPSNAWVVKGTNIVVDSNVTEYSLDKNLVLGSRDAPDEKYRPSEISEDYGWFLLDVCKEKLLEGLKHDEVLEAKKDYLVEHFTSIEDCAVVTNWHPSIGAVEVSAW